MKGGIMNLSENLKKIRKENNLSQEQLAEKLSVSRQSVSKWESGQAYPEMDKVLQLCKLFNVSVDDLLNQDVSELNNNKTAKTNINKFIEDTTKDSQYRANDFKIGHTYFLNCKDDQKFHCKMQYQVLPILREYYIDGIIKEQENFDSFNKYLKGEDLNSDSLEEISDFLKEIIKEFEANSGELG